MCAAQEYDVEVLILILERGAIVGLSLASDRSKRSSNGKLEGLFCVHITSEI